MSDSIKRLWHFNIGTKIFGGFLILILLFAIISTIIFGTTNSINGIIQNSSNVANPMSDAISEWITLVHRSRMLATNWVFLSANEEDKQSLRYILSNEYPDVKAMIASLTKHPDKIVYDAKADSAQVVLIEKGLRQFDALLEGVQANVVTKLKSFEDYEDPTIKLLAGDYVDQEVIPQSDNIIQVLNAIQASQNKITGDAELTLTESTTNLQRNTLLFGILIIALGLTFAYLLVKNITTPINYIRDIVLKLGVGELVDDRKAMSGHDEIGEMAVATDKLVNGLKATTTFAKNIGDGKYDSEFTPLSEKDVLGNALLEMRANLARVAEDDKKRSWTTEGLAKFGELLRENTNDVSKLTDTFTSTLVKYLDANQSALYLVDDTISEAPTLSLISCYAWDKKKYINQKIVKGEGLVGQCWQEMDTIFLTDVPGTYIKITSGLGDANPSCILIVPLKVNEDFFGVVEIASFRVLKDFEIDFVKKLSESLASSISSVKVNANTQRLLEDSQELTEQMRAQEEEMRQNMEELQATQEEMERNQAETELNMQAISGVLAVCEFGLDGNMSKANSNFLKIFGYTQAEIAGEPHKTLLHRDDKNYPDYRTFLTNLNNGKHWKGEMKRQNKQGELISLWCSFTPLINKSGEVVRIMEISVSTITR